MATEHPSVILLGGPNGAGKSTVAPHLLRDALAVDEFVNADTIAQGLSGFAPEGQALAAGRIMLQRLHQLAAARHSFAFEATLAGRSYAKWLKQLIDSGYVFGLAYFWLASPDLAVRRVASRVRLGGHDVSEDVIRRRYAAGLRNFFKTYRPLADFWLVYDGSERTGARLVAQGNRSRTVEVFRADVWDTIRVEAGDA